MPAPPTSLPCPTVACFFLGTFCFKFVKNPKLIFLDVACPFYEWTNMDFCPREAYIFVFSDELVTGNTNALRKISNYDEAAFTRHPWRGTAKMSVQDILPLCIKQSIRITSRSSPSHLKTNIYVSPRTKIHICTGVKKTCFISKRKINFEIFRIFKQVQRKTDQRYTPA